MKILFLHGYNGNPNRERISYLEGMGIEVIAPHIDYDNEPNVIVDLVEEDFDAIVGNSLGGYIGFFLSEYKSVPAILINPPMHMDLKIKINQPLFQDLPEPKSTVQQIKHIILGADDDVVNPIKVVNWLIENKPNANLQLINGMGHRYSQEQFVEAVKCIIAGWLV